MAGERVDPKALIELTTQLATDYADLQLIVRRLVDDQRLPCNPGSGSVDIHVSAEDLALLRRLAASA